VRYVAELELGTAYGPTQPVRLIVATLDPAHLKPESTWYLVTSLPRSQVSAEQVDELYRLRDWIENRQPHYLDRTPVAASCAA
jgi:hypothetical protein